jgi:hypothetical protein
VELLPQHHSKVQLSLNLRVVVVVVIANFDNFDNFNN